MPESVTLSAPSRLHFGLFSVGKSPSTSVQIANEDCGLAPMTGPESQNHNSNQSKYSSQSKTISSTDLTAGLPSDRRFGGVGLMVAAPRTTISISNAKQLTIRGAESVDCRQAISSWFNQFGSMLRTSPLVTGDLQSINDLPVEIEIQSVAARHAGLGSGTQLALCVAAGILRFFELPIPGPDEMALSVGRGKRSAIGTYGFFQGGLLVDRGKNADEALAPLDFRADFPAHWPVLLIMLRDSQGLSGVSETDAFKHLPRVSDRQKSEMVELVRSQIIPGIIQQDYKLFGEGVYQFGRNSGSFFQTIQGGPYNGDEISTLVESVYQFGVPAVGQSSWGPCVFAITSHDEQAAKLTIELENRFGNRFEIIRTHADNQGVRLISGSQVISR